VRRHALWWMLLPALVSGAAGAQPYPSKPIRLVVPFPAGALNDVIGRAVAQKISDAWGAQVVVDNRGGASTIIGSEIVARSAPDGYTLLLMSVAHTINPSVYARLPYDTRRDFAPVSLIAAAPFLLCVHPALPVRNVAELVALARAKPATLRYGSTGAGGSVHLMAEMLRSMAGVEFVHVPYKGLAPAVTDLIAGHIDMSFGSLSTMGPHIKAGRLRALGVTSARRSAAIPDLPTIAEQGYPGYEATLWWGLAAPAGAPQPVIEKLHAEIARIVRMPDVQERFAAVGVDLIGNTPRQFAEFLDTEIARMRKLAAGAGLKPE